MSLKQVQTAIIRYLREKVGVYKVGDVFPQDNTIKDYIHLKDVRIADNSNKSHKRDTLSFTFHFFSRDTNTFLDLLKALQGLEEAELIMEGYTLDEAEITATHSYVDITVEDHVRHGIVMIDFTVTKIN